VQNEEITITVGRRVGAEVVQACRDRARTLALGGRRQDAHALMSFAERLDPQVRMRWVRVEVLGEPRDRFVLEDEA
jgi:hypothetical protein